MSIANSAYSTATAGSAYQTSGKPLSKEALYKAKLKYGIFDSPSTKSTGFANASDASDTAALLAASSDLSIEPYKRDIASDAKAAALFAKDEAPEAWRRESVGVEAQSAAQNAKLTKVILEQRSVKAQGSAASAALHLSAKSIASSSLSSKNLDSLYEFDAIRNGTKRPEHALNLSKISGASADRASTIISNRLNPDHNASRSGLETASSKTPLDLSKINLSKERASTLLSNRLNPERNASRSGLASGSSLQVSAASGALASQHSGKTEGEGEIEDHTLADYAAAGALASQGYKIPEDPNLEAKAVYRNKLVDPKVLAAASLNASLTLKGIDKQLGEKNVLLYNPDYNRIALEIAQKNSESRVANDRSGKIDIGGGLFMTQEELDNIGSRFINPVLDDISKKAEAQRAVDAAAAKELAEQKRKQEEFKQHEKDKKIEEKRLKEEAKIQRRKELEDEKQKQINAKKELEEVKKQELEKTKEILKNKQLEEEKRKAELLTQKNSETEKITQESTEAEAKRKQELEELEAEKNAKLAPILKDLEAETEKLTLLEEERKAIEEITSSQVANIDNSKLLLETSHNELDQLEEQLKTLQVEIDDAQSEEEKLTKEKEINQKETEIVLQKHKDESLERELQRLELEKRKNEIEKEKLKLLLELENEKIDALHDEKKILETLPPVEKKEVVTGKGPLLVSDADKPVTGEGEDKLEKTFSGFSQGSDDEKELNDKKDKKKRKSFFKEFF